MIDSTDRAARILVAYYSATGHVHALAKAVAEGAVAAGAEVRLRPVEELAPEQVISRNQAWGRHRSEVSDEPTASLDALGARDRETTVVAVAQGRRLARVARVIGVAREHGLLDARAGRLAALSESEL